MKQSGVYLIRRGTSDDIPAVVGIEKRAFAGSGAPTFQPEHIASWLEVHPEGFFILEENGAVVAFTHLQVIQFNPRNPETIRTFTESTDDGYTRATHQAEGNTFYGLTLDSISPGAGRALLKAMFEHTVAVNKQFLFGASRISGFDGYLANLQKSGRLARIPASEAELALWYALECAKMVKGRVAPYFPEQPNLDLPRPEKPDPILGKYLRNPEFELCAMIPGFVTDQESRGYAFITAFENEAYKP